MMFGRRYLVTMTLAMGVGLAVTGCTDPATSDAVPGASTGADTTSPAPSSMPLSDSPSPTHGSGSPTSASPLTMYYVARGDNGQSGRDIGCGDSLVATRTGPQTFTNQLRASMKWLLSHDDRELGASGLYNALHHSELRFQSGHVDGGTVTVDLTGTLTQGGVCDAPRIKAQLRQTAMTAVGAGSAHVTVNGTPLTKLLGGKG